MITIPMWLFVLIIILAAPVAIMLALIVLILIMAPFWGLVSSAQADKYAERKAIK